MNFYNEHSRGDWLRTVPDEEILSVDFSELGKKTGLRIDDSAQWSIMALLLGYVRRVRSFEERVPEKNLKRKMKSVIRACNTLEAILCFSKPGKPAGEEFDEVDYRAWFSLLRGEKELATFQDEKARFELTGGEVADYLVEIKRLAEKVLNEKGSPGNRKKCALRDFLQGLYLIYLHVGGELPGYHCNRDNGEYWGAFLILCKELLSKELVGENLSYEYSQLYEYMGEVESKHRVD